MERLPVHARAQCLIADLLSPGTPSAVAPRNVLLVPSAYAPNVGGIEEVTRKLAEGLQKRGYNLRIVTNHWPDSTALAECIEGIQVTRIPFHLPAADVGQFSRWVRQSPASARLLVHLVRETQPHVLHVIGAGPNAAYVAGLRRILRRAIVLSAHGELSGDAHGAFQRSTTLRLALRTLCVSADAVTAPSSYTLDELRATFPIAGVTEVIPNGVDVGDYVDARPFDDLGPYVLSVGRLVPQKGFDTLLDAFADARDRLGNRKLLIAGDGPERGMLEQRAAELGLAGTVTFLGAVDHSRLPSIFSGADAFVLASRKEAFGLVALEAMASGTPVIASTVGGITEILEDGHTALLVPPDRHRDLASALVRLLEDDQLQKKLTVNALCEVRSRSWDDVLNRYEALYERIGAFN